MTAYRLLCSSANNAGESAKLTALIVLIVVMTGEFFVFGPTPLLIAFLRPGLRGAYRGVSEVEVGIA
jgi:hypothetical protein